MAAKFVIRCDNPCVDDDSEDELEYNKYFKMRLRCLLHRGDISLCNENCFIFDTQHEHGNGKPCWYSMKKDSFELESCCFEDRPSRNKIRRFARETYERRVIRNAKIMEEMEENVEGLEGVHFGEEEEGEEREDGKKSIGDEGANSPPQVFQIQKTQSFFDTGLDELLNPPEMTESPPLNEPMEVPMIEQNNPPPPSPPPGMEM